MPSLQDAYHLSLREVGVAIASVQAGAALTLLLWGLLADRVGERLVIAVGLTGAGGAMCLAAYAPDATLLISALVAAGVFGASASAAGGRAR